MTNIFRHIKLWISALACTCFFIVAMAQTASKQDPAITFAQTITIEELQKHLEIIAGPSHKGRGNGQEGQKITGQYLAQYFQTLGLPAKGNDGYFQTVPLQTNASTDANIVINGTKYEFMKDFYVFPRNSFNMDEIIKRVTFAGYGIDDPKYSDYNNTDPKGKTLAIWVGEPMKTDSTFWITQTKEPSEWTSNWRKKIETARNKGVKSLIIITPNIEKNIERMRETITNKNSMQLLADATGNNTAENNMNVFYVSEAIAQKIFKTDTKIWKNEIDKKAKPKRIITKTKLNLSINKNGKAISVENVLGFIEGTDLKNEILVITAHYDHLGTEHGETYYGADDDGSGTVALLEIAQAFVEAKKAGYSPRRSILIMPVAGEENGLLGSRYFTDIQPIFPLKNIIADLNIDMIGRIDDNHDDGNYVYIIGSDKLSIELHQINEQANKNYTQLELDYKFNDPNDPNRFYYRSDHYNFAKNKIPIIFYFNGVHDDYHKPTDTVEKINYQALQKRTLLVFHTAWLLANRDKRIVVDSDKK